MTMTTKESLTDVAFRVLSEKNQELSFGSLWQEVAALAGIPEEKKAKKKAQLYSSLMLDNRFTSMKGNMWDLRKRRKFDEVHANKALLDDVDDDLEESEEDEDSLDANKGEEDF